MINHRPRRPSTAGQYEVSLLPDAATLCKMPEQHCPYQKGNEGSAWLEIFLEAVYRLCRCRKGKQIAEEAENSK